MIRAFEDSTDSDIPAKIIVKQQLFEAHSSKSYTTLLHPQKYVLNPKVINIIVDKLLDCTLVVNKRYITVMITYFDETEFTCTKEN